ncbi:MAG: hypothetical protein E7564_09600 [Ruminococcaceae bacterium]|nr:hypothetical protein [Oscillospiraceae bacterium]
MNYDFDLNKINEELESETKPLTPAEKRRARRLEARKKLEKNLTKFTVMAMSVIFACLCLFLLIFPRSSVSNIENRELAKFPEFTAEKYFSGQYTAGIATFYDDTVPYRDSFKNAGNNFKGVFGLPAAEDEIIFINGPDFAENQVQQDENENSADESNKSESQGTADASPTPGTAPTTSPSATPDSKPLRNEPSVETTLEGSAGRQPTDKTIAELEPDQTDFTKEEAEVDNVGSMIIIKQAGHYRGLELFGGGSGSKYIAALNELQEKVGDKTTIWSMPAPLACEFYTPANAQQYVASQANCFDKIASQLSPEIRSINICSVLLKHTEEPIYLRTDHHWTALGAYYAARTFAEAAQVPFADISEYTKKTNEGYVGTLYAFSGDSRLLNDPEPFDYYVPNSSYKTYYYNQSFKFSHEGKLLQDVSTANSYLMFISGDSYVVKVDTNVNNGRKLLVIKDSYGNAEIPFYTSSFETIYVADVRYLERNLVNFIEDLEITDVLFTMSAFSVVGANGGNISKLMTQDAGTEVIDTMAKKSEVEVPMESTTVTDENN